MTFIRVRVRECHIKLMFLPLCFSSAQEFVCVSFLMRVLFSFAICHNRRLAVKLFFLAELYSPVEDMPLSQSIMLMPQRR